MKIAILADVKANETALRAVLTHARTQGVEQLWFLGSLVSYGPDPAAVAELVFGLPDRDRCLAGHPDQALINEPIGFNSAATRAFTWARKQLSARWWSGRAKRARWNWLCERPSKLSLEGLQFFACTPLYPETDVLPVDDPTGESLRQHMDLVQAGSFVGALSRPGILFADALRWQPVVGEQAIKVAGRRFIACPGSVGQPRDRDARAAYATYDGDSISWHRVPYDVAETVRRFRLHAELDERHALRLERGV